MINTGSDLYSDNLVDPRNPPQYMHVPIVARDIDPVCDVLCVTVTRAELGRIVPLL